LGLGEGDREVAIREEELRGESILLGEGLKDERPRYRFLTEIETTKTEEEER